MALRDKYRIAYLNNDETILFCLIDVWAETRQAAIAEVEKLKDFRELIWIRLQIP